MAAIIKGIDPGIFSIGVRRFIHSAIKIKQVIEIQYEIQNSYLKNSSYQGEKKGRKRKCRKRLLSS
jgi:hypothetical protein